MSEFDHFMERVRTASCRDEYLYWKDRALEERKHSYHPSDYWRGEDFGLAHPKTKKKKEKIIPEPVTETKRKNQMNYSTAVMLINQNIRAIKTIYKPDLARPDGKTSLNEPRVIYKTLDKTIKKGDLVVVETHTRHGMTAVLVDEVDVDVDFESEVQVRWVVDKVNTDQLRTIQAEEAKWIDTLKASEKRRKREEIKKNLLDMYGNDAVAGLPIALLTEGVSIEKKVENPKT